MKQKYEAIFIIRCNEDSKKLEETIEKINNIVISNSFNIYYKEKKGEKKLAYEVKGEKEGVYYYIKFETSEKINNKLEEIKTKINTIEDVLKYIIIKLSEE